MSFSHSINLVKLISFLIILIVFAYTHDASAITNTQSMDFEKSSNQYISITDGSQSGLDVTGDITIEAWVKIESLDNTGGVPIINKGDGLLDSGYALSLENYGTNDYRIWGQFCQNSNCSTASQKTGTTNLYNYIGQWVHLAITWQAGTSNEVQLYVNGVEDGDGSVNQKNASAIRNTAKSFYVGASQYNNAINKYFDGMIDEVRVWNDVRTPTEIADNMMVSLSGGESNLVSYWNLNATSSDKTSNANTLTLVNSPSYSEEPAHQLSCSISGLF